MMELNHLEPLPMKQSLSPITNVLLTDVVANITHSDGSRIRQDEVLKAVVNGYLNYFTMSSNRAEYQFSCSNSVSIGTEVFHAQTSIVNGRNIYKQEFGRNYLFFARNRWIVSEDFTGSDPIIESVPCPQRGVKFQNADGLFPPLPIASWQQCADNCLS